MRQSCPLRAASSRHQACARATAAAPREALPHPHPPPYDPFPRAPPPCARRLWAVAARHAGPRAATLGGLRRPRRPGVPAVRWRAAAADAAGRRAAARGHAMAAGRHAARHAALQPGAGAAAGQGAQQGPGDGSAATCLGRAALAQAVLPFLAALAVPPVVLRAVGSSLCSWTPSPHPARCPGPSPPQGGRGSVPNGSRQAGGSGGGMMGMDYGSGGHGPALMFNPFMMQHPLMMQHQQQHPGAAWGAGMMQQQVGGMGGDGCVAVGQAASVCLLRVRKARLLGLCVINPAVQPCALHAPRPPRPRRAARGTAACRWGVACTRRWVWRAPTPPTPATTLCPRAGQVGGQTRAAGGDRCRRRGARWGGGGLGGAGWTACRWRYWLAPCSRPCSPPTFTRSAVLRAVQLPPCRAFAARVRAPAAQPARHAQQAAAAAQPCLVCGSRQQSKQ